MDDHRKAEIAARIASCKAPPTADQCPNCGESRDLAKIKGCLRCLKCHWKQDCYGI
jgi:ribosomal protein S27AE